MDTINNNVLQEAAMHVIRAERSMPIIHTVTITLDGATGGALVTIEGFTSDELDETLTLERTVR
jgi:hypothetical protein